MSVRGGRWPQTSILALALLAAGPRFSLAEVQSTGIGGFTVVHEVVVPATPEEAFDAFTGDITPWWDHSFSGQPKKMVIEPRPGGGFYEIFDDQGNGALHATVIFAQRGRRLRFDGPLGFSGFPLQMVHTVEFDPTEEGTTRVHLTVRVVGELKEGWSESIDRVWHHFLVERFKPYVESLQPPEKPALPP